MYLYSNANFGEFGGLLGGWLLRKTQAVGTEMNFVCVFGKVV